MVDADAVVLPPPGGLIVPKGEETAGVGHRARARPRLQACHEGEPADYRSNRCRRASILRAKLVNLSLRSLVRVRRQTREFCLDVLEKGKDARSPALP
jgi:hypothetical protein